MTKRLGLTERELASELHLSLTWLRNDRRGKRLLPFFKLGDGPRAPIRYSAERVNEALAALEEGGTRTR